MKYLTYSGNHLINAKLPDSSEIYYPQPAKPGVSRSEIPEQLKKAVENPLGMPPLKEQVNGNSKVLIAFDNNCQPFPMTKKPDMRQSYARNIATFALLLRSCEEQYPANLCWWTSS